MSEIFGSMNMDLSTERVEKIYPKLEISLKKIPIGNTDIELQLGWRPNPKQGIEDVFSGDNKSCILLSGVIYNRFIDDDKNKEHSNADYCLKSLKKEGLKSVEDWNGTFVFAYWDDRDKKLILGRDPFGTKPLYYFEGGNKLLFSTDIKLLREIIDTQASRKNLAALLKLRYLPSPDTAYQDIMRLRPAHTLEYDCKTGSCEIHSYQKAVNINPNAVFNKALSRYGELFEEAVDRQMKMSSNSGLLLSGGVDSALVGYFMARKSAEPIKTFTVGYGRNYETDELVDAEKTAEFLKSEHHEIIISDTDFANILSEVTDLIEEPLGTTSSIPLYYLSQEASKFTDVVFTGQGADEPLCGYTRYKGIDLSERIPGFVFNAIRPWRKWIKNEKINRGLGALGEKDRILKFEKSYMIFDDSTIKKLMGITDSKSRDKIQYFYDLLKGDDKKAVEAMMSIDMRLNLADDLLLYTDKICSHFGLSTRLPFLDHELIHFLETLPQEFKLKNGKGKYIHREFARQVLPVEIIERKKKGFQSPAAKWFRDELSNHLLKQMEESDSEFLKFFDINEIQNLIERHRSGWNMEKQLFLLYSIFLWFETMKK